MANNQPTKGVPQSALFKGPQIAPGVLPGVRWEDCEEITCKCGGKIFSEIHLGEILPCVSGIPVSVVPEGDLSLSSFGFVQSPDDRYFQ